MTTLSPKLGLTLWGTTDNFRTAEITGNFDAIDDSPGLFICASTTRPPSWGAAHKGMLIYETDRDLYWKWTGSGFEQLTRKGWLADSKRTAAISTALFTPGVLVSVAVNVPATNRPVEVTTTWGGMGNDRGTTAMGVYRDATLLQAWEQPGLTGATNPAERPRGGSMPVIDTPGAGLFTYSLQFSAVVGIGGMSTLTASVTQPCTIAAKEI